jgi:hypothetical protein
MLFAATTAGHIFTVDSYLNYLVTGSVGERGKLEIPRFMMTVEGTGGRHFSKLGTGLSIASVPLFWLGSALENIAPGAPVFRAYSDEFAIPHGTGEIIARPQNLIRVSEEDGAKLFFTLLTNALVAAALCLIFWLLLRDFGLPETGALWGTALLAFATPLWVYSRDFFTDPLFALSLVGSFYLLHPGGRDGTDDGGGKRIALAGLLSSLGILARASFIPLVGIFAAYLVLASGERTRGFHYAGRYLIFCVPGLAVFGVLNAVRFGSPFLTGYHTAFDKGFSVSLLKGLAWNLGSPYRSLFLYAPATLLVFLSAVTFARKYRKQFWLIAAITAYVFIIYSKWWAWHGGWCWGPRFLVPVIPLLLLPGLASIPTRGRWLLAVTVLLGIAGFIVQLGGVLINYTAAYDYWIKIGKLDWAEADIQLFSPISTHLKAVAATSPCDYDLWLIQAYQVSPLVIVGLICVLLVVMLVTAWPFLRNRTNGSDQDRSAADNT